MAEFVGFDPIVQVSGEAVSAVVHGMGGANWKALEILAEHNIHNPKWEMWYLQQNWLSALQEISETLGQDTIHAIGRKIPENAIVSARYRHHRAGAAIDRRRLSHEPLRR